jgi:DNA-binding GntR family transcriptional regulator
MAAHWHFSWLEGSKIDESFEALVPPRSRGLAHEVTNWLRDAIVRGHFAPGQHLLEEELAEKWGISRGPVREALVQLEHEGLVILRRHRGAFVARLSHADAHEVYGLQLALERLAAECAAQNATDEDWAALQRMVESMKEAHCRGMSQQEAADLDVRFHDLIYSSAHHERLWGFWSNLRSQVYILLLSAMTHDSEYSVELADSHRLVLDALRTRNRNLAIRIVEDHITRGFDHVRQSYIRDTNAKDVTMLTSNHDSRSHLKEDDKPLILS